MFLDFKIQGFLLFSLLFVAILHYSNSFKFTNFKNSLINNKKINKKFKNEKLFSEDPEKQSNNEFEKSEFEQNELSLGFSQLKPFLKIAIPFFKEDEVARSSLVAVAALTLLNSGISVAFSYISRDFYNALNARDEAVFYEKIELFFCALVLAVPVSVYYRFKKI
jgi:hypothetical protein